ncbi:hypothetical protein DFH09DRAFT_1215888 [Mycena vulgaris]|nr:hypothetical protein DFH09DRAFT_1215888 [Mycena vulgaris]
MERISVGSGVSCLLDLAVLSPLCRTMVSGSCCHFGPSLWPCLGDCSCALRLFPTASFDLTPGFVHLRSRTGSRPTV